MKKYDLTEGAIFSNLIWFTVPFLLSNVLQMLYGTVDTLVIGNFGSTSGLSAVACGAELLTIITYMAIGMATGGTVLLGQYIGKKDYSGCAKIVGNLIISFFFIGIILMWISFLCAPYFLSWIQVPEEAMDEAILYMHICSNGIPVMIGYNIICAILRAMGDSKSPLIFVIIACIINILGDVLLTGHYGMGVLGVAIATITAQIISFICSLIYIVKKGLLFEFSRKDIRFDLQTSLDIFKIGIPMGLQSILINLSFLFITAIINSMGLSASAAMGIGDKIITFAFIPQGAFATASAVIVAQNYGAGKMVRAQKTIKYAIMICLSVEVLFFTICQMNPTLFPSLFSRDPEVIKMAGQYMQAYSIDAILTAVTFNLSALLNGCGKTTYNMAQNLLSTFFVRIPCTWFFSQLPNTNLFLIGCAAPASTVTSIVMLLFYIRFGKWAKTGAAQERYD